jgi:hypothetical protein
MNKEEFWVTYSQRDEANRRKMLMEDLNKVNLRIRER